jgi:hypothetical protein
MAGNSNSGRPGKYLESTIIYSKRIPKSLKQEIEALVEEYLKYFRAEPKVK